MNRRALLAFIATALINVWAREGDAKPAGPLKLRQLRLYQPENILAARTDADSLADGAKAIQQIFATLTAGEWRPQVKGVLIAVAIRPGQAQRVWVEFIGKDAPAEAAKFEAKLTQAVAPKVSGLVAYALEYGREGENPAIPTIPKSWQAVAKKAGRTMLVPDDVVDALWPDVAQRGVAPDKGTPVAPTRK